MVNVQNFTEDSILQFYWWSILVTVASTLHKVSLQEDWHTLAPVREKMTEYQLFSCLSQDVLYAEWMTGNFVFKFFFYYFKITDEQVTLDEPDLQRLSLVKRSKPSLVVR